MTTTTETLQVYRVYIKATPQAIGEAITKPEWTEKYGYQAPVEYDLHRVARTARPCRGGPARRGVQVPPVTVESEAKDPSGRSSPARRC
jgi:hypothetical protein